MAVQTPPHHKRQIFIIFLHVQYLNKLGYLTQKTVTMKRHNRVLEPCTPVDQVTRQCIVILLCSFTFQQKLHKRDNDQCD